jgi:uncharacterized protein DUF903
MKLFATIVLLGLVSVAGCVRRYDITLTNQRVITSIGKPKEDKAQGVYRFKDAEGRERVIPSITVQEITAR